MMMKVKRVAVELWGRDEKGNSLDQPLITVEPLRNTEWCVEIRQGDAVIRVAADELLEALRRCARG